MKYNEFTFRNSQSSQRTHSKRHAKSSLKKQPKRYKRKELEMIRSGGVFFVAARPSKSSSKEASTLELNPMTAAEVEQAALAREHAASGTPGPAAGATLDGDREPTVRIRVPTGPATPSAEERALHEASGHVPCRSWCQWCIAAQTADKPHLR